MQRKVIPYARQWIDAEDVAAVTKTLLSDWLTTGPRVADFEAAVTRFAGAAHGVAVSSGTAALHAMLHVLGIKEGDEVLVPAMTFAATANAVCYVGGRPVFVDVCPDTLLIDPADLERKITSRSKAVIAVDYAGQPCDYEALDALCARHGLTLLADACHSLGGKYQGRPVGTLAAMTALSFHPVKHVAAGEGGMVLTDDPETARLLRRFRNHGIDVDARERERLGSWHYEMVELGFNYRLSDIHCALGLSQMAKLPAFLAGRRRIAAVYDAAFGLAAEVSPLKTRPEVEHAYHLYVIRLAAAVDRKKAFAALREQGVGTNVHYIPVHLHPYYRKRLGTGPGLCPAAESVYEHILSLPMFPALRDEEAGIVITALTEAVRSALA